MSDEIRAQIVSPDVKGDSVVFRLRAPKATEAFVVGVEGQKKLPMVKGKNGVWAGEYQSLVPGIYSYAFEVDGTRMIDPSKRGVKKWLSLNSMFEIRGGLVHEFKNVPHGELREIIYGSATTKTQRKALVYTPPGYSKEQELPLMFLLHGYGDDHLAWKEVGRANYILDNLISEKRIKPCVVVMPYGHPIPLDLKQEFDDYAGQNITRMNDDLVNDLLPHIRKQFSVSADRSSNAIVGLSMGGGQSISIGLNNLNVFSKVGGFSSATAQGEFPAIDKQFSDLVSNVELSNQKLDEFWIACGKEDFLFKRNNHFVEWLESKNIEHTYHVSEGGHDWMVWRKYLVQFLELSFPSN